MKNNKGFTLLVAIVTTSLLLLVSFVVVNVALKQLVLANASQESQYAFYAADSGTECAVYHDLKTIPTPFSLPFRSFSCNGSNITPTLVSNDGVVVTSRFTVNFPKGCAVVTVAKNVNGSTSIDSRGYNTCPSGALRRFERGVTLSY